MDYTITLYVGVVRTKYYRMDSKNERALIVVKNYLHLLKQSGLGVSPVRPTFFLNNVVTTV